MTPSASTPAEPSTTATGDADAAPTGPLPEPVPFPAGKLVSFPDVTVLDDEDARRLLAPVMRNPAKVWAYASAAVAPGAAPVDEVLLTEISHSESGVVWVRHPGSYSSATGHLLRGPDDDQVTQLRRWEHWVFELADLVEAHGDQMSPTEWPAQCAYIQMEHLRWAASYGMNTYLSGLAHDNIRDYIRDHPDGALTHDLGDLSPDDATWIAENIEHRPATMIPPGWNLQGWDHTRTRAHPILARLRPDTHSPPHEPTSQ